MGLVKLLADLVYRNDRSANAPNDPDKAEIRGLFATIDREITRVSIGDAVSPSVDLDELEAKATDDLIVGRSYARVVGDNVDQGIYAWEGSPPDWVKKGPLPDADVSAIQSDVDGLSASVNGLDQKKVANLNSGTGHGATVGDTMTLVCTGGNPGAKDEFGRFYRVNTPAVSNTVPNITLSIDGTVRPLYPARSNSAWEIGSLPISGRLLVMAEGNAFRVYSSIGALITETERGVMRRAGTYDVGEAERDENESGVTLFIFRNDDIPSGVMNPLAKFTGVIGGLIPQTNERAKVKVQILRTNGAQVTGKIEMRTAAGAEIRARGVPTGFIQFVARPGVTDESDDLFLMLGGASVGGDGGFDEGFVEAVANALDAAGGLSDPFVRSSRLTEITTTQAEKFAAVEKQTDDARGAVAAAYEALNPGFIGQSGFATTMIIGDERAVSGALIDENWIRSTAADGRVVQISGANLAQGQSSQLLAAGRRHLLRSPLTYRARWIFWRVADGEADDTRTVRMALQFLDGLYASVGPEVVAWTGVPTVAGGKILVEKTLSFAGSGVDYTIPAGACAVAIYGRFFGVSADTRIRFLGVEPV